MSTVNLYDDFFGQMVEDSLYHETRHEEVHAITISQNDCRCSLYRESPVYVNCTY